MIMPQTMKTYKQFIEDIQESSLSRIQSKSKKSGVAAISADRGCLLYTSPSPRD
mgnify:CR=1 FL=1